MPNSRQNDSLEFESLALPYNRADGELSSEPRLVSGLNMYVTFGGKLAKRPGTIPLASSIKASGRIDRLVIYETLDTNPFVFLLASIKVGSVWEMFYQRRDDATPVWTSMGSLRDLNVSTRPHEIVIKRGLAYIKGFPGTSEKLGSVIFNGTANAPYTTYWGLIGPQTPASLTDPTTWPASAHPITILGGWKYTYSFVTRSGQVSNQAPLQTNPDKNPSVSGPFVDKIPQVTITGIADTTNVPSINMYRTTDGGGTFYFVKQIANPGATTVLFEDKYLGSGGSGTTFSDPIPDANLDITLVAPTLTSNSPPPSVVAPGVVGVDTIQPCSPIVEYAGRLWYAMGQYLFYSALEELNDGVPEEAWPSGLFGNFFRFQFPITNLQSTIDGLYIYTLQNIAKLTGTSLETFNPKPFLNYVGHPKNHPKAITPLGNGVGFLTQDFRIAMIEEERLTILSDPLLTDITDAVAAGSEMQLNQWAELDKDYLIVTANNPNPALSRQWVLDRKRTSDKGQFWFTPWNIPTCGVVAGRVQESTANRRLIFVLYDGTNSALCRLDATGTTASESTTTLSSVGYAINFTTHLMSIPPGNHYNALRRPGGTPVVQDLMVDRTVFPGDDDPLIFYFLDDFWTNPIQIRPQEDDGPPRRNQSTSYKTLVLNDVNTVGRRVAVKMSKLSDILRFELHTLAVVWNPEGGA